MMQQHYNETVLRREMRQFGIGLGLLLLLSGGGLIWTGRLWVGGALLGVMSFVVVAFWFAWPGVSHFYIGWMKLARTISGVVRTLLLTLLYLLLLTPMALLARLCGHKFVERNFDKGEATYWLSRSNRNKQKNYEKQS